MKLFLKDHLDIILLYLFNAVFLSYGYHRLDGFQTVGGIFYFLFLSLFLLLLLMALRYARKRKRQTWKQTHFFVITGNAMKSISIK